MLEAGSEVISRRQGKSTYLDLEDPSEFKKLIKGENDELRFPGETGQVEKDVVVDFDYEIEETIKRGLMEGHSCQDITREITSLKLTENKTFTDCINSSMDMILKDISSEIEGKKGSQIVAVIKKKLQFWDEFFQKFCGGLEDETKALMSKIEVTGVSNI